MTSCFVYDVMSYPDVMNLMISISEMNMSTRGGGRGGRGPNVPRYPGVRMYRDDYRRDRPDDRRSNRYNNDDDGESYGGNNYGGNDFYNSG